MSVLKKFKRTLAPLIVIFFTTILSVSGSAAVTPKNVPLFYNVGVIPIQWQFGQSNYRFRQLKEKINDLWKKVPSESGRFRMVNTEVAYELWSTPQGRQELAKQYELHAFLSLTATLKADLIVFTSRLLSPNLESTYLHEAQTFPLSWLYGRESEDIHEGLKDLVFRMLNRLPVDALVTSVQGNYVTLSAGATQNIRVGDELMVIRTRVKNVHPATGAWLDFISKKVGTLRVLEVGEHVSIGQIIQQSHEGAIKVNDGAKVPDIPSRNRFRRLDQETAFAAPSSSQSPILFPSAKSTQPPTAGEDNPGSPAPPPIVAQIKTPPLQEATTEEVEESTSSTLPSGQDPTQRPSDNMVDEIWIAAGPRIWNASGSGGINVSSSLPFWLLNSFQGRANKQITENMGWEALGNFELGQTQKGSYYGFGLGGKFYYILPFFQERGASLRVGGTLRYQSIGVSGERYGGEDVLKIAPYVYYEDQFYLEAFGSNLAYFGEFDFGLLGMGQVGTRGQKRSVSGYSAWRLQAGGVIESLPRNIEWGGLFLIANESYSLDTGSLSVTDLYLGLLARYRF